jgi:hypothetical protein
MEGSLHSTTTTMMMRRRRRAELLVSLVSNLVLCYEGESSVAMRDGWSTEVVVGGMAEVKRSRLKRNKQREREDPL